MSRVSVIVSKEPPDPEMDPRVAEILQEAQSTSNDASKQNYDIGENFDYYEKDLNVVDDVDEDSDNDNNNDDDMDNDDNDDNDNNENDEAINVAKKRKPKMTKQRIRQENKDIKETKIEVLRAAKEAMEKGEFPSIRACALYYNIAPSTLGKKLKSGEDYVGSGRRNEVTIIVVQGTGSYTGKPYLLHPWQHTIPLSLSP